MAAETGSGKTGAFCLPVLQITWESLKDLQKGKKGGGGGGAKGVAGGGGDNRYREDIEQRNAASLTSG